MFDSFLRLPAVLAATVLISIFGSPCSTAVAAGFDDPTDPPTEPAAEPAAEPEVEPEPAADESSPAESAADAPTAEATTSTPEASAQQSRDLDMVLHYILIGKPELVKSSIETLFDSGITDEQIAKLVDERGLREKVERAVSRGRGMDGVGAFVVEFETRFLAGTRASSRNALRIEEAVTDLGGTMRQQMIARGRLLTAGEYAVPALLKALSDGSNAKLAASARVTLVDIKRLSVAPLCAALPHLEADTQRKVCEILGEIGYPSAQPYLLQITSNATAAADVRAAASRAYDRLGGTSQSAASQFTALARRYFDQTPALIPYASEANNAVWKYDASSGLVGIEIPTPIYCETMAIQTAMFALTIDPSSDLALATYVAADLRRAVLMKLLKVDPAATAETASILVSRYSAEFFATASGASITQLALGFAIDASDVLLARACIAVLATNGGASSLVTPSNGRSPIIECLLFADRRVRFDAALVLARALPQTSFSQDSLVVPILGSMVQSGGTMGAVIASTEEDRQALASRINALGVGAVTTGGSLSEVEGKLATGQTVDLVIIQGARAAVNDTIRSIRVSRAAATAPVVLIASGTDAGTLAIDFENDARVSVFLASATDEQFAAAIEAAVGAAGGIAMSQEDGALYAQSSLGALQLIAESASPVFDIRDCESGLIAALGSSSGSIKSSVARVLALMPSEKSQRALMDAALAAGPEVQEMLLGDVATSARKFGNLLQSRQLDALRSLISNAEGSVADAAGQAFGALGLPSAEVVKLIVAPAK
ncbi:MAG: hypothetical protein EXS17_00455 [Phycisphaerales bacterium]|nr:hypothetical protein [Phycisphaerales bacterium]